MTASYLLFRLDAVRFAVNAQSVQEMFWIPALSAAAEMPPCIRGVLNLRGHIIPIMDLSLRLGKAPRPFYLDDMVIVLEQDGAQIGMIVSGVYDVCSIGSDVIEAAPLQGDHADDGLVVGMARTGVDIVMILDVEKLIRLPSAADWIDPANRLPETPVVAESRGNIGPDETAILRDRADTLARQTDIEDSDAGAPLVVISLSPEYFAIPIMHVREFTSIPKIAPIPCCPAHIVGALNLRGEILTLVDIRGVLQIPAREPSANGKVMVVDVDGIRAGVLVDAALDVINLRSADIAVVPAAVKSLPEEYIGGAAPYAGQMLSILNISRIFARDGWVVNEVP